MIIADNDYKPDNVLFECQPFVHHIYHRSKDQICDHCLAKSDDLKQCSGCKHMYYCNENCQRRDWRAGHRYECQIFKSHYKKLLDEDNLAIPLLRLYLIIKADPQIVDKKYETIGGQQQRCFADLMSHCDDIMRDRFKVSVIYDIHKRISSCGLDLTVDDLVDLFGKFIINSYFIFYTDIIDQSSHTCGAGLFIGASVLDHSCAYNVYIQSAGNKLQVIAGQHITAGDELTTFYVNPSLPTVTRRMLLKSGYYFDCHCCRCDAIDDNDSDITVDLLTKPLLPLNIT
ncbi:histone-lysine N-methyltransferase SMYD3-like [Oppia nitens]|uniref:histone-lysine N-methyltransferase SMYD3-like n=1 Tax=Oppia nitens TaxID=1686743 RepID=UPI0023DA8FEA|nr:histone-lysine N-methyltransferase SMYD3-like [Oppia nitens]